MMRKPLLILMGAALPIALAAQTYCVPPPFTTGPFTGISNVKVGTLDNNSSYAVGVTYFDQVAAPKLEKGMTYSMSVTTVHTLVGTFSGNLYTHAWIDFNQDGDFTDAGELVYKVDDEFYGKFSRDITIPANAKSGMTRMRVYNDMPDYEGHEYPHPCGYAEYPGNFLGQHGESEDYNVEITGGATGITSYPAAAGSLTLFQGERGQLEARYLLNSNAQVSLEVFNALGQRLMERSFGTQPAGNYRLTLDELESVAGQLVIVHLRANEQLLSSKTISY